MRHITSRKESQRAWHTQLGGVSFTAMLRCRAGTVSSWAKPGSGARGRIAANRDSVAETATTNEGTPAGEESAVPPWGDDEADAQLRLP